MSFIWRGGTGRNVPHLAIGIRACRSGIPRYCRECRSLVKRQARLFVGGYLLKKHMRLPSDKFCVHRGEEAAGTGNREHA